jgi:phospholipase C
MRSLLLAGLCLISAIPARAQSLDAVQHIVIILKENHTFDNYFGLYPGADGATTGLQSDGSLVPLTHATDIYPDIDHTYPGAETAWDNGKMDGFDLLTPEDPDLPYVQYWENDIPVYWGYARDYVLADEFFTSVMGPSFPNHLFTITATSFNAIDNPDNYYSWGCDAPPGTTVPLVDGYLVYPCFTRKNFTMELDAAGISWKFYGPLRGEPGYAWTEIDALESVRRTSEWHKKLVPTEQFALEAASGNLPAVSWVIASEKYSEHPPRSVKGGMNWTAAQVSAIQNGPDWPSTVIFISWDDFGGFYDHVPPPQVDLLGFGFRAPLLIISPFARHGLIFHEPADFSSLVRFIEKRFGLQTLGMRDRIANDLLNAFDFSQTPDGAKAANRGAGN